MNAFVCLLVASVACTDMKPQVNLGPSVTNPTLSTSPLARPGSGPPISGPGSFFDPTCDTQPPREYATLYARAHRRHPDGASDCMLARQGQAESNFRQYAVSPAGAIGIAQFMPDTARSLGIDPFNPSDAILAQAKYQKWCRDGWSSDIGGRTEEDIQALGLGCYNFGRSAMFRNQSNNGWVRYKDALPHLPDETQGYIRKIMRLK